MNHSMAQPAEPPAALDLPAWKNALGTSCAVILGLLFIVAGVWKITDPFGAAARLAQFLVPHALSLPSAILLGITETFAGVLLFVPRFRRWGAWLTGGLLVVFMIYVGANYSALQGEECSCFPWIKRAVGPGFFVGDAIMLAMAGIAGIWARPTESRRVALMVLGAVSVFALVSFGVAATRQTGTKAPEFITVDARPMSLQTGKIFIYFFDPECAHCDEAARHMAKYNWNDVKLVSVATRMPQFAAPFLNDTGFRAGVSDDLEELKQTFPFGDPPYAVAIEDGRQKAALQRFDEHEPEGELRKIGFVE